MTTPQPNGWYKWVAGILAGVTIALASAAAGNAMATRRAERNEARITEHAASLGHQGVLDRLDRREAAVDRRLGAIEDKLDRLLEVR